MCFRLYIFHGYFKLGKHVELVIPFLFLYDGLYQEVIFAKSFGFVKYANVQLKQRCRVSYIFEVTYMVQRKTGNYYLTCKGSAKHLSLA